MKYLLLFILFFDIASAFSTDKPYKVYTDNKDKLIIEGEISISDWYIETGWDSEVKNLYSPDESYCKNIQNKISNGDYKFIVIAGSWCGDTKSELPKLLKIMDVCNVEDDDFILIGVGRDKVIRDESQSKYPFESVMTLIIENNGIEIGRIVEFPESSWEYDILNILDKQ